MRHRHLLHPGLLRCIAPMAILGGFILAVVLLVSLAATGKDSGNSDHGAVSWEWRTGYWVWQSDQKPYPGSADILYVEAGAYSRPKKAEVSLRWPRNLPVASTYFALLRMEDDFLPPRDIIP